jgi:hypothetical protein
MLLSDHSYNNWKDKFASSETKTINIDFSDILKNNKSVVNNNATSDKKDTQWAAKEKLLKSQLNDERDNLSSNKKSDSSNNQ